MNKADFKLANKLAIPPSIFPKLSKKDLYILEKNAPDEIEQYWDLISFPKYLINKYNLTPEDAIISNSNATQKDYELFLAWKLASFMSEANISDIHFALALPKYDRGVECYIRCLDIKNEHLVGIPIQICDIVFTPESIKNEKYEKTVLDLAVKAKAKPVDCNGAILLMNLRSNGDVKLNTTIDRFILRDLFDKIKWSYRKIIFLSSSKEHGDTYVTVYSDSQSQCEYFIGHRKDKKIKILIGKTELDERKNNQKENSGNPEKQNNISFWF